MDERWTRIRELFRAANELDASRWESYLASACPDDAPLRERVLEMLRGQDREDDFLDAPAIAPASEPTDPLEGRRIGPYAVVRVIARGGMGVVYEARDVRLDKVVALKTMNPMLARDPKIRQRFEQEARTLARLEDPHVVRIHALQDEGPDTFIVMEYVQGPTLADYLRRRGRLNARETLFLTRQLLTALSKAHRLGIVHRDLKPANVMLARDDEGRPLVKVLDFGIAKQLGATAQTLTHGAIGTLLYMAPEQVRGAQDIDGRADLYALGVMLYEMLAGELPYDRQVDEYSLRRQIVEGPVEPLHRRAPDVPGGLSAIVERALAKTPADRYATAEDMLRAMQTFEQQQRQPAIPPTASVKKRRPLAWVSGVLALACVVGIGYLFARSPASVDPDPREPVGEETLAVAAPALLPADTLAQQPPPETPAETTGSPSTSSPPPPDPRDEPVVSIDPPPVASASTSTEEAPDDTTAAVDDPPALPAPSFLQLAVSPIGDLYLNEAATRSGVVLEDVPVDAGLYAARVVNDTYGEWRCEIAIEAGVPLPLAVDFLTPILVTVAAEDVDTNDPIPNAEIFIDGKASSVTPQTVRLQGGVRRIVVRSEGYRQIDLLPDDADGCYQKLGPDRINFDRTAIGERTRVVAQLKKVE
ncbi:MAG: serine/threonine-protein kinase [Rhodothermales bacterium]